MSCTVIIKDKNLKPENIKKGVTILKVKGTLEGGSAEPVLQDASLSYTQNGTYTLNASSGYDGLGTVTVDVSVAGGGGETPLAMMEYLRLQLMNSEQSTSSYADTDVVPFEEPTAIEMFFKAPITEGEEERHFIFASIAEGEYEPWDTPFFGAYEYAGDLYVNFGGVEGLSLSDADYHFSNGVHIYAEKVDDGGEAYWEVTVNGKPVDNVPYVSLSDMGPITIFGRSDGDDGYTEFASDGTCFGYVWMGSDDGEFEFDAGCELIVDDTLDEPEYDIHSSNMPYIRTYAYDYVNETETINWIPVEVGEYDEIHARNISSNIDPITAVSGMNVLPIFESAYFIVNVDTQTKTVNPSTNSQNVTADSGYTALGSVTVNPVTSAIDSNIQASNIKTGVTILGVTGTYSGASGSPMLVTKTYCGDVTYDKYSIAYNQDPNWQAYIPVSPDHSSASVTLTVFSNENYQIAPGPNSSLDYQEGGREYTYTVNHVGDSSDVVAVITTPTFTQTIEVYWEE